MTAESSSFSFTHATIRSSVLVLGALAILVSCGDEDDGGKKKRGGLRTGVAAQRDKEGTTTDPGGTEAGEELSDPVEWRRDLITRLRETLIGCERQLAGVSTLASRPLLPPSELPRTIERVRQILTESIIPDELLAAAPGMPAELEPKLARIRQHLEVEALGVTGNALDAIESLRNEKVGKDRDPYAMKIKTQVAKIELGYEKARDLIVAVLQELEQGVKLGDEELPLDSYLGALQVLGIVGEGGLQARIGDHVHERGGVAEALRAAFRKTDTASRDERLQFFQTVRFTGCWDLAREVLLSLRKSYPDDDAVRLYVKTARIQMEKPQLFPSTWGLVVISVDEGSPAALGGMKVGDVIFTYDGKLVHTTDDMKNAMLSTTNDPVQIAVLRELASRKLLSVARGSLGLQVMAYGPR